MNNRIKGSTKLYAVIGDPIEHSLSPEIHNTVFDHKKENSIYIPLGIKEEELEKNIYMLRNNFLGFNVTKPHKQKIMKYIDQLDDRARVYNAVNTVKVVDGKLIGYNTDGYGFSKSIENVHLKKKRALLLGAGGAASVVAYEILQKGAYITIANRNIEKAKILKEQLLAYDSSFTIEVSKIEDLKAEYYFIVNATPIGMNPKSEELPVSLHIIKNASVAYDLIYNPNRTKFLKIAEEHGCKIINGFSMLFYQAIKAQEIWNEKIIKKDIESSIYKEIEQYLTMKKRG
ncbi:shikimate dehydrogenase [Lutibacter sp. B2]|nr:shikimate dehydrogenase [Lutibacter sp. B2]